jgi:hypothetical protein
VTFRMRLLGILGSAPVQLLLGVAMMVGGAGALAADGCEAVVAGAAGPSGAHGLVLLGALHAIKAVLELVDGFGEAEEVEEAIVDRAA